MIFVEGNLIKVMVLSDRGIYAHGPSTVIKCYNHGPSEKFKFLMSYGSNQSTWGYLPKILWLTSDRPLQKTIKKPNLYLLVGPVA